MTMTTKEVREHAARRALEVALVRKHPHLSDGAIEYLVAAAQKTVEWAEAVQTGADFDVNECVHACEASDVGQLIFLSDESEGGPTDHVAATKNMTPAQQINYARKHGLR